MAGIATPPSSESPHATIEFSFVNAANAPSFEKIVFILFNDAISGGRFPPLDELPHATIELSLVNAANA